MTVGYCALATLASSRSIPATASGSSSVGAWPTCGTVTSSAPLTRPIIFAAVSSLNMSERSPRTMSSGRPCIASIVGHMSGPDAPDGALDMLLEIGDSVMTHRRRYNVNTARLTVTDLLALDPLNPRSILFQMNEIHREVEQLPNAFVNGQMSPFYREAMRLHSGLAVMTPETMTVEVYQQLARELERLSDLLARTYLG